VICTLEKYQYYPTMKTPIFDNSIRTVPNSDELPDDAELWRYMRLSTLLMLLRGKVFVPTIEELRSVDPFEAKMRCLKTHTNFGNLPKDDHEWLMVHAQDYERKIIEHPDAEVRQKVETLRCVWDRELARRRTIWCWHNASIESMALWNIYAKEGVAVKTTPARIKKAFDPFFVDTALIAPVSYTDDPTQESGDHHFMRPYLFKRRCYHHEREVRVIFPRIPSGNRLLPLNAKTLVSEVRISPFIPRSEAIEIRQSLMHAYRIGNISDENEDEIQIFPSDATTVYMSPADRFEKNQSEPTGITCFGSNDIPFVACGDFRFD
jgi:hypothetical protein